jgi:phospholipid/cholesterol/gamma-HCH transport system permease protein
MVTALMVAYQLEAGLPKFYVGATGGRSILIEIAPLVISLLVVARVGSNITARIGTMKVTEQIDALETMGINSVHYLALPIILASIVVVPALVIYSDFISLVAAAVSAKVIVNVPTSQYIFGLKRYATLNDVLGGLLKTPFFGLAMGSISVYYGFQTELGAEGVGSVSRSRRCLRASISRRKTVEGCLYWASPDQARPSSSSAYSGCLFLIPGRSS